MKCACRRVCRVHLCIQNGRSMSVAYLLPCVSLLNEDGHTKKKKSRKYHLWCIQYIPCTTCSIHYAFNLGCGNTVNNFIHTLVNVEKSISCTSDRAMTEKWKQESTRTCLPRSLTQFAFGHRFVIHNELKYWALAIRGSTDESTGGLVDFIKKLKWNRHLKWFKLSCICQSAAFGKWERIPVGPSCATPTGACTGRPPSFVYVTLDTGTNVMTIFFMCLWKWNADNCSNLPASPGTSCRKGTGG